jgi:hypothetical protein
MGKGKGEVSHHYEEGNRDEYHARHSGYIDGFTKGRAEGRKEGIAHLLSEMRKEAKDYELLLFIKNFEGLK